jgi:dihydroxy-acid dehydratase
VRIAKKLPSRITVEGLDRAPHRAFLHALGVKGEDLKKPFVGVASTDGRVTPCNALLGEFAREACAAGGPPGGVGLDIPPPTLAHTK